MWLRGKQQFVDGRYRRGHVLRFDGGITVPGSSSPHVVPLPYSVVEAVDPEEIFVASLASCHMLWFLSIAAKHGFVIDLYHDAAYGVMAADERNRLMMKTVVLRPYVKFSGGALPTEAEIAAMHHQAHEECFIANSVKTEVLCRPAPSFDNQPG
jgi:organic hydroperoxide reductase OsmC/OhrA